MAEIRRISPEEAHERVQSGRALLICAYEDDNLFRHLRLEGAISLGEFKSRLPSLSKDQELIFYCR